MENIVQKSVLFVPIPAGLNARDEDEGSIFRATPSQVGVLSRGEKGILQRIRET